MYSMDENISKRESAVSFFTWVQFMLSMYIDIPIYARNDDRYIKSEVIPIFSCNIFILGSFFAVYLCR